SDIDKLIKKKIDIEPLELDDEPAPRFERPRRRPDDDGERVESRRGGGRSAYAAPRAGSSDPFFDRPYEPNASTDKPAWEKAAAAPVVRGLSPNIKPKRRVAALFGGKPAD
ncbi:MAG: ATP-dependent helicase, partial [Burkholderiales bacterium]